MSKVKMRKVSFQIPEPRFKRGDIVGFTNSDLFSPDALDVIVCVWGVVMSGRWEFYNGSVVIYKADGHYECAIQEGSRATTGQLLRPGTVTCRDITDMDHNGRLITDYRGKVWEPDTHENINQRDREWKARFVPEIRELRAIILD